MSYELGFWAGGDDLDPTDTFLRLGSEQISSIRVVDVEVVMTALESELQDWTRTGKHFRPPGTHEASLPYFVVEIGEQMVVVTARSKAPLDGSPLDDIVAVMKRLGYRHYDPQLGTRFPVT